MHRIVETVPGGAHITNIGDDEMIVRVVGKRDPRSRQAHCEAVAKQGAAAKKLEGGVRLSAPVPRSSDLSRVLAKLDDSLQNTCWCNTLAGTSSAHEHIESQIFLKISAAQARSISQRGRCVLPRIAIAARVVIAVDWGAGRREARTPRWTAGRHQQLHFGAASPSAARSPPSTCWKPVTAVSTACVARGDQPPYRRPHGRQSTPPGVAPIARATIACVQGLRARHGQSQDRQPRCLEAADSPPCWN